MRQLGDPTVVKGWVRCSLLVDLVKRRKRPRRVVSVVVEIAGKDRGRLHKRSWSLKRASHRFLRLRLWTCHQRQSAFDGRDVPKDSWSFGHAFSSLIPEKLEKYNLLRERGQGSVPSFHQAGFF